MLTWLADVLRAEGLAVSEVDGWRSRGGAISPRGVMLHHTASSRNGGANPALNTVTLGRSDLPGPLCNVLIGRDGRAWVVAAGRANHAGSGGPWRTIPANTGNLHLVGIEMENDGLGEPWGRETLDACDRACAAILRRLGRDHTWVVGHKEWTTRKIDPSFGMDAYRRRLKSYMEGGTDAMTPQELRRLERVEQRLEGMQRLVDRRGEPADSGPLRWGWRLARGLVDRALSEAPPPGEPGPHNHPHEHTLEGKAK